MSHREIHGVSEREYKSTVFTPPRDDAFGMAHPFSQDAPKWVDGPQHHHIETRQALALVGRVLCCFIVIMAVIVLCYGVEQMVIKEPMRIVCHEQSIINGKLLPGVAGSKAIVQCDDGYEKGAPVELHCLPVQEKCVVLKKATVLKEEVKKCWRRYAYVTKRIEEEAARNRSITMKEMDVEEEDMIPHACLAENLPGDKDRETKLYSQQHRPSDLRSNTGPLVSGDSLALLSLLVMVPAAVLLVAGVARARSDEAARGCQPGLSPPSAVDDDDELLLGGAE